jgi:hypothetical protein
MSQELASWKISIIAMLWPWEPAAPPDNIWFLYTALS